MAAEVFLGLAGEGFGFGVFTAFATAVVSLATVLVARFAFVGTSSSASIAFFALPFGAAGALDFAGSGVGNFVSLAAFGAATFFTGLCCGLAVALPFFATAFGFAACFAADFVAAFTTSAGFSSTSAT